jgi:hypothetical protein
MPNDFLVKLAQAYIAQPLIQIGYKVRRGGVGTVTAIVMLQPIEIAQAKTSTQKRNGLLFQSSCIQSIVGLKIVSIITLVIKKAQTELGFLISLKLY